MDAKVVDSLPMTPRKVVPYEVGNITLTEENSKMLDNFYVIGRVYGEGEVPNEPTNAQIPWKIISRYPPNRVDSDVEGVILTRAYPDGMREVDEGEEGASGITPLRFEPFGPENGRKWFYIYLSGGEGKAARYAVFLLVMEDGAKLPSWDVIKERRNSRACGLPDPPRRFSRITTERCYCMITKKPYMIPHLTMLEEIATKERAFYQMDAGLMEDDSLDGVGNSIKLIREYVNMSLYDLSMPISDSSGEGGGQAVSPRRAGSQIVSSPRQSAGKTPTMLASSFRLKKSLRPDEWIDVTAAFRKDEHIAQACMGRFFSEFGVHTACKALAMALMGYSIVFCHPNVTSRCCAVASLAIMFRPYSCEHVATVADREVTGHLGGYLNCPGQTFLGSPLLDENETREAKLSERILIVHRGTPGVSAKIYYPGELLKNPSRGLDSPPPSPHISAPNRTLQKPMDPLAVLEGILEGNGRQQKKKTKKTKKTKGGKEKEKEKEKSSKKTTRGSSAQKEKRAKRQGSKLEESYSWKCPGLKRLREKLERTVQDLLYEDRRTFSKSEGNSLVSFLKRRGTEAKCRVEAVKQCIQFLCEFHSNLAEEVGVNVSPPNYWRKKEDEEGCVSKAILEAYPLWKTQSSRSHDIRVCFFVEKMVKSVHFALAMPTFSQIADTLQQHSSEHSTQPIPKSRSSPSCDAFVPSSPPSPSPSRDATAKKPLSASSGPRIKSKMGSAFAPSRFENFIASTVSSLNHNLSSSSSSSKTSSKEDDHKKLKNERREIVCSLLFPV